MNVDNEADIMFCMLECLSGDNNSVVNDGTDDTEFIVPPMWCKLRKNSITINFVEKSVDEVKKEEAEKHESVITANKMAILREEKRIEREALGDETIKQWEKGADDLLKDLIGL